MYIKIIHSWWCNLDFTNVIWLYLINDSNLKNSNNWGTLTKKLNFDLWTLHLSKYTTCSNIKGDAKLCFQLPNWIQKNRLWALCKGQLLKWRILKGPGLQFSGLSISVLWCYCRNYDDNIGPKYKKLGLAILGCKICVLQV